MKKNSIIAVYDNHAEAIDAIKELVRGSIDKKSISVLGQGEHGEPKNDFELVKENEDIAIWGERGAFWGGLFGFLAGMFFFWIPGFGPIIATGHIISSLAGAVGGAVTAGSLSALTAWFVDLGIEEIEAVKYEDLLKKGKILIFIHGSKEETEKAKEILGRIGKGKIRVV